MEGALYLHSPGSAAHGVAIHYLSNTTCLETALLLANERSTYSEPVHVPKSCNTTAGPHGLQSLGDVEGGEIIVGSMSY